MPERNPLKSYIECLRAWDGDATLGAWCADRMESLERRATKAEAKVKELRGDVERLTTEVVMGDDDMVCQEHYAKGLKAEVARLRTALLHACPEQSFDAFCEGCPMRWDGCPADEAGE